MMKPEIMSTVKQDALVYFRKCSHGKYLLQGKRRPNTTEDLLFEWIRLDALMDCILEEPVATKYTQNNHKLVVQQLITLYARWWVLDPTTILSFADRIRTNLPNHEFCRQLTRLVSVPLTSLTKAGARDALPVVDSQYNYFTTRQLACCANRNVWFQNLRENDAIEPLLQHLVTVADVTNECQGKYEWVRCDRNGICPDVGLPFQQQLVRYYRHMVSTPSVFSSVRKRKLRTLGTMMERLFRLWEVDGWFDVLEGAVRLYLACSTECNMCSVTFSPSTDQVFRTLYRHLVYYEPPTQRAWALRLVLAVCFEHDVDPIRTFYKESSSIAFEDKADEYASYFGATVPDEFRQRYVKLPEDMKCPITYRRMQDPVQTETGMTYDRPAIEQWLATSDICPLTGATMQCRTLTPDKTFKRKIRTWETRVDLTRRRKLTYK